MNQDNKPNNKKMNSMQRDSRAARKYHETQAQEFIDSEHNIPHATPVKPKTAQHGGQPKVKNQPK